MRTLHVLGFIALAVVCFMWHSAAAPVADTIYGKVTFEDGTPAVGASVRWLSLDPAEGATPVRDGSNATVCTKDGVFKFEKLKKGPFRIEATARQAHPKPDLFAVLLKVAQGTPNLKIVLKCGSSVNGRVVDTKGKPVTAFKVGAFQRYKLGGPKDTATATSGLDPRDFKHEEGQFVYECLPDGEWELFVSGGETVSAKTVKVTLPQTGEPITLTVPPFSEKQSITGRVLDPQGNPVVAAKVTAAVELDENRPSAGGEDSFAKTEKDGVFRLEKLRTWPLKLSASAPGFGKTELVRLDGTESAFEIVLKLRPACKLIGDVTDANGQPVEDCIVLSEPEGVQATSESPQVRTDAQGHFELPDLAPGPNIVVAFTENSHAAGELVAAKRVVLAADTPVKVKLKVKPRKE